MSQMVLSELTNYLERIEDLRHQIVELISDLPLQALNWRPIEGKDEHITNSLAVLASHVSGAEHFWIAEVIGNRKATRDRNAEFSAIAINSESILNEIKKTAEETREVFSKLDDKDLNGTRQVKERIIPVRWCILHVVDHTALHLGHMQITYQLWSGGKSFESPLWFERLPKN